MAKFKIKYALGGGFGGVDNKNWEIIEADSLEEAQAEAYRGACGEYYEYEGMYGLRTVEEIMEDDKVDAEEAQDIWNEERESWLDYVAEPYNEGESIA